MSTEQEDEMTRPGLTSLLVSLALVLATSASAQSGMGNGAMQGPGSGPGAGMGQPGSAATLHPRGRSQAQIAQVFAFMDSNGDGLVTHNEYMSVRMGGGSGFNAARMAASQARKESRFTALDADGSGSLTLQEFGGTP